MPGLHPGVIDFARRVVDRGFHVRMPSLFGTPGKPVGVGYTIRTIVGGCVAREFTTWALHETSPIIGWLRALAADAHDACGGPGVGAVGMCFTGGFALGGRGGERVEGPAVSQPSVAVAAWGGRPAPHSSGDGARPRGRERAADAGPLRRR